MNLEEMCRCFHFLTEAGMDTDTLKRLIGLMENKEGTGEEQARILRKCRCRLLGEIHTKQQLLDKMDYLIYEIKSQGARRS